MVLLITAIIIVFSCASIVFTIRSFSVVLASLGQRMKASAEQEADLTVRLPVIAVDETGKIAHYFNQFLGRLAGVVGQVKESSNKLVEHSSVLQRASQEAGQLGQQSAATAQQIASGAESQARNLGDINTIMQNVNDAAINLQNEVHKVLVETADAAISQVTGSVREMAAATGNIGQATEVIANIADQTRLLALNAAIEAARAGEHGRGFAVVADAVGKLAEESGNSVKEIEQLIAAVQEKAKVAQQQLEASIAVLRKGNESTIEELKKMVSSFQEAVAKTGDLAAVAQETAAATEESSAMAEEQAATAENISASAEELLNLAKELNRAVELFRTGNS